jgi:hypothetical protein
MEHLRLRAAEQVHQGTHPDRVESPGSGPAGRQAVSLAALIAVKPGQRPRLIYRVHARSRLGGDTRTGFTAADHARLLDAAHQQLGGPVVPVWGHLNTRVSRALGDLLPARDWLTVFQLPPYASELSPAGGIWSVLKGSVAGLAKHDITPSSPRWSRSGSGGCSSGPASWQAPGPVSRPLSNLRNWRSLLRLPRCAVNRGARSAERRERLLHGHQPSAGGRRGRAGRGDPRRQAYRRDIIGPFEHDVHLDTAQAVSVPEQLTAQGLEQQRDHRGTVLRRREQLREGFRGLKSMEQVRAHLRCPQAARTRRPVGRHRICHDARSSTGRSSWDQERVYRACSRLSRKAFTASAWSLLSIVSASSAASMSANAVSSRIKIAFSDRLAQRIASGGSDASS